MQINMTIRSVLPGVLIICCASVSAMAQAPDTTKKSPVKFSGDVGLVNAAGNSDVTTLNVGDEMDYASGPWKAAQTFSVVYGRNEGVVNTSLWRATLRGDRAVSDRWSVYALTAFDRNTFAGFDRRFEEGIGATVKLVRQPRDQLDAEAGISFVQQHSIVGANDNFPSARIAGLYQHNFTRLAFFKQGVELLPDLKTSQDLRVNTESDFVAPLSQHISLKLSYVIRFDNLPEPGFKKTDRLLTSGIQITY